MTSQIGQEIFAEGKVADHFGLPIIAGVDDNLGGKAWGNFGDEKPDEKKSKLL